MFLYFCSYRFTAVTTSQNPPPIPRKQSVSAPPAKPDLSLPDDLQSQLDELDRCIAQLSQSFDIPPPG